MVAHSVMRIGLLPIRIWGNDESDGVDLSGLGAIDGQLSPKAVQYWEGVGTDEMHIARKRMPMIAGQHRPRLNDTDVNLLDYTDAILRGFESLYRTLLQLRDALLADDGPLMRFQHDEVRVIVRATQTYGLILGQSFHPHILRNALDRDRHFDRLWVGIEQRPYLARVIAAEHRDLQRGDIPMFITRPNMCDAWSSDGECIRSFFDESSMTIAQRRIQQLSIDDLAQQLWFIRASLATASGDIIVGPTYTPPLATEHVDATHLLNAARTIGDRLEMLALRGERDATWIGVTSSQGHNWQLTPMGLDLYGGLPGVTLFLAHLGALTGEQRYTRLAQYSLTTIQRQIEAAGPYITAVGGFAGWGGVIYTLTHLSVLWNQRALLAQAEELATRLPPIIMQDKFFDIIGGVAGGILALTGLYRCSPAQATLTAAVACGDRLLETAAEMEVGLGWQCLVGEKPLAGFAHGAAGIALALLELSNLSGEERFRIAAQRAIAYERTLFSPDNGNWRDMRDLEKLHQATQVGEDVFINAWCHGAPGIGLARLHTLRHLSDVAIHDEIAVALRTTLSAGFWFNHSLCHGDLGNLELLTQARDILGDSRWDNDIQRISASVLASIERDGPICGLPLGVEAPGLMVGLAGVGYGLLRLADPQHVPSVLILAPPTF
jgi:type 2 lantibiotic biosynthesis protein LanM